MGAAARGALRGVRGFAIGDLAGLDPSVADPGPESAVEVLRDRVAGLGVPILSGLPIGHLPGQVCVPLGTTATIDTDAGTLTAESAVS